MKFPFYEEIDGKITLKSEKNMVGDKMVKYFGVTIYEKADGLKITRDNYI